MSVVNLDDYRQGPEEYDGFVCPSCGSAWFTASVGLNKDLSVTSRVLGVTCVECGTNADV